MTDTRVADTLRGTLVDGRYRVQDRVARGGMATVFTAIDERLERTVALKIVHPSQANDPRFVARFIDEAKTIARLSHPNVVAAYDQGTHEGLPYLVMEYVPGHTLREILASRHRLTPVEALAITEQMLAAIAAAHRTGLVHRDVKPENVMVAAAPSGGVTNLVDSVVKVTDFGLAQAVAASSAMAPGAGEDPALLATAAYVPPEVVTHERADPCGDVYSVGVVLFEMLTGRVPFEEGTAGGAAAVAWQHVQQEVPAPSRYAPGLPRVVDDLVSRATHRDPTGRPPDADAFLADVQAVREQVTTSAVRGQGTRPPADATVVLSAVAQTEPVSQAAPAERPSWARLPSPKTKPAVSAPGGPPGRRRAAPVEDDDPVPRRSRPQPGARRRQQAVIASFVAVLALLLAVGGWWFGFGRWIPAPDLLGLPQAEAVTQAEELGLEVTLAEPRYSEEVPLDHVLAQDPGQDDRVLRDGTVTLTLSLGPERHPVPDIIGADAEVAMRQLETLGLEVVEGEPEFSNTVPEGRVLSVEPEVGEDVSPGDRVTVTVSDGRPPISVPAVIGDRVEAATQKLQAEGLEVATEEVESDRPQGEVVGQTPEAGIGAEPGDTVQLEVSAGPPTRPVPGVTGDRCGQAIRTLEEAGFEVVLLGNENRGRVRLQNPSEGTGLPPGSEVTLLCA